MNLTINTNVCPIVDVDMYDSAISPMYVCDSLDNEIEIAHNASLISDEDYSYWMEHGYDNFDLPQYNRKIEECAVEILKEIIPKITEQKVQFFKSEGIDSPAYYNYRSDVLEFTIAFDDSYIDYIKANISNEFFAWAEKELGSRDGFISFMPTQYEKFIDAINGKDVERAVSLWIVWCFITKLDEEEREDYRELFLDDVYGVNENSEWSIECITDTKALNIWDKTFIR